jgi:ACS family tartrate transporter-like MFS transporter
VFILEGVLPFLLGFFTLYYLTDRPRQAKWLDKEQREWLAGELEAEDAMKAKEHRTGVFDALRYSQTYLLIAVYFLIVTGNQALLFFLPSITNGMDSMSISVRTLAAALPYACSAAGILLNGLWANRTGALRWHTAIPPMLTGFWLAMTVFAGGNSYLRMALFCLAGFSSQAYLPPFFTLPTTIFGKSAAAAAVGLICLANLGGFVGPWLFGELKKATGNYDTGIWVLSGCMAAAGLLATRIRVPKRSTT